MAFWDAVQQDHVRQAVAEYDQFGQEKFLARHGFGPTVAYLLIVKGKTYDSKAVLGVAYKYATGRPLGPKDFSGGAWGAAGRAASSRIRGAQRPRSVAPMTGSQIAGGTG